MNNSDDIPWASVKLLVLDFDGVMTDNRVLVDQDGKEAVWCHRGDGLGIEVVKQNGVEVIVLSKEKNPVVSKRCEKLNVTCIQGCDDKRRVLEKIANSGERISASSSTPSCSGLRPGRYEPTARREDGKLKREEIVYVGNDVNDLECMEWVGIPVAVADAVDQVKEVSVHVVENPGGHGAVREVCDIIIAARNRAIESGDQGKCGA